MLVQGGEEPGCGGTHRVRAEYAAREGAADLDLGPRV